MSKQLLPMNITLDEILVANDGEIRDIVDRSLQDMVADTFSLYKDPEAKRAVVVEISLVRLGNEGMYVDAKVSPKPAPYTRKPEKPKVAKGQTSLEEFDEFGELKS